MKMLLYFHHSNIKAFKVMHSKTYFDNCDLSEDTPDEEGSHVSQPCPFVVSIIIICAFFHCNILIFSNT